MDSARHQPSPMASLPWIICPVISSTVVMFPGAVVVRARSSKHDFFYGFCREYEGEYFYGGNLSKNNLWRSRSNNKSGGLKLKKYLRSKNKFNDEIEKEDMMNIMYFV